MAHSAAITYPAPLRAVAAAVHGGAALLCGAAYASSPPTKGRAPSPVWRGVAAAFAGWAIVAAVAPFPLATLPTMLGRRLSRAWGAFSLLYASSALALATAKDDDCATAALKSGVKLAAAAHFLAVAAKLVFERGVLRSFYPSAFSKPVASLLAFGSFGAAFLAASDFRFARP